MKVPELMHALLWLYEGLWLLLASGLQLLARSRPQLTAQVQGRHLPQPLLAAWRAARRQRPSCAIFFCSSAGEYEQAKPLAQRLIDVHGAFVVFIMASESGRRFAEAQHESLPYHKAPWDRPSQWRDLFAALEPTWVVVVRYELWPGFLATARRYAPIYLIDAVQSQRLREGRFARMLWQGLLRHVTKVFAVGPLDAAFYREVLGVSSQRLAVVGDTKFDRVLERIDERKQRSHKLQQQLRDFLGAARIVVIGSAWPDDLQAFLSIYPALQAESKALKVIVAPHDISAAMIAQLEAQLQAAGLSICRVSRDGMQGAQREHQVLMVDTMGSLAELYSCAHVAWVGGAMHHRVHNVLEPACRGIYICFGPLYHSSREAVGLVDLGLARVVKDGAEFLAWWQQLNWDTTPPHQELWQEVRRQQGASERILSGLSAPGAREQ